MRDVVGRRVRMAAGLLVLAEFVVFVLVASWIGLGWTILATLATSALGFALLARQGTKALVDLRERARSRRPAGRELGDAGLVAAGGLLMVLPGFIGDLIGLLCLLPVTRGLVRGVLTRLVLGPAARPDARPGAGRERAHGGRGRRRPVRRAAPLVIEGEIVRGPDGRPADLTPASAQDPETQAGPDPGLLDPDLLQPDARRQAVEQPPSAAEQHAA